MLKKGDYREWDSIVQQDRRKENMAQAMLSEPGSPRGEGGLHLAQVHGHGKIGVLPVMYPADTAYGEGNGTPLEYSCLENPWTEEPGRLQSMGSLGVGHD